MMHRFCLLLCLAWLPMAQPAAAQSLLNAWDAAQLNDAQYQKALATRDMDIEDANINRANLLPQLGASGAYGRAKTISTFPTMAGPIEREQYYNTENWVIQLRQAIFDGTDWANYRSGQAREQMAQATLVAAKQSLGLRLVEAATQLAQSMTNLQTAELQVHTKTQVFNVVNAQWRAGEASRADVKKAQSSVSLAKRDREAAAANVEEAKALWMNVVGLPVSQVLINEFTPDSLTLPGKEAFELRETAALNNPAMQAARYAVEMTQQQVRAARAGHLPTVDLVASHGYNNSETDNTIGNEYETSRVQLQMQLPLYSGGSTSARVRQNLARERIAKAELKDTNARLHSTLASQVARFEAAKVAMQAAVEARDAADAQFRQAELGRRAGTATLADFVEAEYQQADASRAAVTAKAGVMMAWAQVMDVMGLLNETAIAKLSEHLALL